MNSDTRKMTVMAYASDNRTTTIGLSDRIAAVFANLQEARKKRKLYRQTYNELSALTNAELADIGMNRSMIKDVAQTAADNV